MEKVTTPEFRASFAHVFKPRAFKEGQEPKYSVVMLFDEKEDLSALKKLAKAAADDKWPKGIPTNLRSPFRKGSEKPDLDGYEGKVFITASSKMQPGVVDNQVQPILNESDFYSGCYARATVTAYAYDHMGNKGVAFGLQNIQKLRDGEPFSGRSKAEDDFDVFDTGNEDDFLSGGAKAETVKQEPSDNMFT